MEPVKKWEYTHRKKWNSDEFNSMGQRGWELIAITCAYIPTNQYEQLKELYVFKRPFNDNLPADRSES